MEADYEAGNMQGGAHDAEYAQAVANFEQYAHGLGYQ